MNWQHPDHGWAPSFCKSKSTKIQPEPRELKIPPGTVLRRPWWPAAERSQWCRAWEGSRSGGTERGGSGGSVLPLTRVVLQPNLSDLRRRRSEGGRDHRPRSLRVPAQKPCGDGDRRSPRANDKGGRDRRRRSLSAPAIASGQWRRVSCSCRGSLIAVAAELRRRWKGWGDGSRIDLVREKQIDGAWCIYAGMRTARNAQSHVISTIKRWNVGEADFVW